ncbi:MAG: zinc-binding dehydrogenase [Thermoflexales bacterium]|nr:zinc-binding dehydrogenase [Thermoflexales bacterium]MDW8373904.1 zinc-binding dehydrogenase [Planctomycetota bacterium]
MKSVRLHAARDLRLHDEPIPPRAADEALLRVTAVGVCGSDLHWYNEAGIGDARLRRPLVLGHEFAAVVADGPHAGRRVAVDPAVPCGRCEWCRDGHPNLCPHVRFSGHGEDDGALREFMAWPAQALFPLPDAIDDAGGAMLEPLGVALHTVDLAHVRPGMHIGVFGCGPIGLLTLQVARLAGAARLFATDLLPGRLDAARELGATDVLQADGEAHEESRAILAATGGRGLDVVFDCAGAQAAVDAAFDAARIGGKVILCGIPSDDRTAFVASVARRKGLTIKMVRRMKHAYPRAIELVARGLVNVRALITHRYKLEQAPEAFAVANRREGIKVMIEP